MQERVGIREFRRSLSRYVARAARGERIVVTEHGRPVATLAPWIELQDVLERLVGEGRATRPRHDLLGILPLHVPVSNRGTEALLAEREERLG